MIKKTSLIAAGCLLLAASPLYGKYNIEKNNGYIQKSSPYFGHKSPYFPHMEKDKTLPARCLEAVKAGFEWLLP